MLFRCLTRAVNLPTFAAATTASSSCRCSAAPPLTRSSTEKMSQMPVSSRLMLPCWIRMAASHATARQQDPQSQCIC